MLYNILILNGVALEVKEYNPHCAPCSKLESTIPFSEVKVMKIDLPKGYKNTLESIKEYINLNHLV